ncbi:conserved Plasmodium protein, unknown function [Plasmodium malariae]|uniref:PI31 proteasome regulator N-terminal domain-containing protein n=1 Tax=Plasmodium malariae TaxID=5858 RepID=A0A1C3KY72_PLAMA|nr:conserved Plasmodium protein, unknown function [Plasmodium malariae]
MKRHDTFKDLIRLHDNLKKEEILALFFHSCILNNCYNYILNEEKKYAISNNEKIKISNGYIKYTQGDEKDQVFISRILIDPLWRKSSNNYNFTYKSTQNDDTYNLNILKIEKSLVLQIINTAQPSTVHTVTINMNEYINNTKEENIIDKIEETINIEKLENIFQNHILNNMNKTNVYNTMRNNNSLIIESNIQETQKENMFKAKENQFLQNFTNDYFDDKNPTIEGRNLIPNFRKDDSVLKPDGLLVGPNNKFFSPKNLRYDPMGPFGNEPNADNKPFEFQNNFPF